MEPIYRIYYGKYPDQLTNEIPNEHITNVEGLQFRIEPGKPAEPKIDEVNFRLKNLDHNGEEIYPREWFQQQSLSHENGAVAPLQLFFRIEMVEYGQKGFTGVVSNKKYGKWRESVEVTVKDPRSLIRESDVYMLKPFTFEQFSISDRYETQSKSFPDFWDTGFDLEGTELTDDVLKMGSAIETSKESTWDEVHFDHDYFDHRNFNQLMNDYQPNFGAVAIGDTGNDRVNTTDTYRSTYVQIGESTILTRIFESIVAYGRKISADPTEYEYWAVYQLWVVHANNGNIQDEEGNTILERGRFFADDKGNEIKPGEKYDVTIYDPNFGFDNDILLDEPRGFSDEDSVHYVNGYPVTIRQDEETYDISSAEGYFDTLSETLLTFEDELYSRYYGDPNNVELFDYDKATTYNRQAFRADLMLFGWMDTNPTDIIVNLAMQLNCYLYFNEAGKIVFHHRLLHEDYLPDQLPPGAFEVQLQDIEPIGEQKDDYGFDSYKIEYTDRIPINNVESDNTKKRYVGSDGIRNRPALRSSDITINAYRSDDLGVPTRNFAYDMPVFRYSPASDDHGGIPGVSDGIDNFIPMPEQQAQNFAKSWQYPVSLWPIQWDMPKYPQTGIGKYFWVDWGSENRVYFIRDITHDADKLLHKMEVQLVGVYTP